MTREVNCRLEGKSEKAPLRKVTFMSNLKAERSWGGKKLSPKEHWKRGCWQEQSPCMWGQGGRGGAEGGEVGRDQGAGVKGKMPWCILSAAVATGTL